MSKQRLLFRIHRYDGSYWHGHTSLCGMFKVPEDRVTDNWENIDCKNCIKHRDGLNIPFTEQSEEAIRHAINSLLDRQLTAPSQQYPPMYSHNPIHLLNSLTVTRAYSEKTSIHVRTNNE